MTPQRKAQIDEIFHSARDLTSEDQASYLGEACGSDLELRAAVEGMLADHQQAERDHFLSAGLLIGQLFNTVQELKAGDALGRYRIESKIGSGGMGIVYLASDGELKRRVAIKVLPDSSWRDSEERARFRREMRVAAILNHPNIVAVYDVGEKDGRDYLVMEYVPGKPLSRLIPQKDFKPLEAFAYASSVADALAAAHDAGIVHRDVKPANVMGAR